MVRRNAASLEPLSSAGVDPTRFLLIRHAESVWNASGRWQGQADPPLSERGRRQAEAVAADLAGIRFDVLISSDLARALETARIIGRVAGVEPQPDRRLRELDVGAWAGLGREEIARRAPERLARFESGDPDVRPGGGETRREIRQRVRRAFADLAARHDGRRVAVVTHLGVIRALLQGREFGNAEWCEAAAEDIASPEPDAERDAGVPPS
jgi:broad specificity phosphatase PhoE